LDREVAAWAIPLRANTVSASVKSLFIGTEFTLGKLHPL
jgi:hypothetical protein